MSSFNGTSALTRLFSAKLIIIRSIISKRWALAEEYVQHNHSTIHVVKLLHTINKNSILIQWQSNKNTIHRHLKFGVKKPVHCTPLCLPEAAMPARHDVATVRYALSTGPTLHARFMVVFITPYHVPNSDGENHCQIIDAHHWKIH